MNYFFGGPGGIPACRQAGEPPKAYASRFILPHFVEDGILFRETDETVCLMFFWWAGRDSCLPAGRRTPEGVCQQIYPASLC